MVGRLVEREEGKGNEERGRSVRSRDLPPDQSEGEIRPRRRTGARAPRRVEQGGIARPIRETRRGDLSAGLGAHAHRPFERPWRRGRADVAALVAARLGLQPEAEEGVAVRLVHVHAREAAAEEALGGRVEQREGLEVEELHHDVAAPVGEVPHAQRSRGALARKPHRLNVWWR